jgi:hypothetical protein
MEVEITKEITHCTEENTLSIQVTATESAKIK